MVMLDNLGVRTGQYLVSMTLASGLYRLSRYRSPGGASRLTGSLHGRIRPVCSLVAPCQAGAAPQRSPLSQSIQATRAPARRAFVALVVLLTVGCTSTDPIPQYTFRGGTMGTTFTVTVAGRLLSVDAADHLGTAIDNRLTSLDAMMSTYDSGSEVSRFKRIDLERLVPGLARHRDGVSAGEGDQ